MRHLDAGLALEQFAREMGERASTGRGVAQRAGLLFRQRDEILQCTSAATWVAPMRTKAETPIIATGAKSFHRVERQLD